MVEEMFLFKIKSLEIQIIRTLAINNKDLKKSVIAPPTQMRIIGYVLSSSKDVFQKDLEDILNLRRATVSGVLQTMEKNELIRRINCDNDARIKKIVLEDKAKILYTGAQRKLRALEKKLIKGISNDELETFSKVLSLMQKNIIKEEGVN